MTDTAPVGAAMEHPTEVVDNLDLLRRTVESWGPGACGAVEVHNLEGRQGTTELHNDDGRCVVVDPTVLEDVDCRSPFVSLHLRRLSDRTDGRLPLNWERRAAHEREDLFLSQLPVATTAADARRSAELAMWFGTRSYATWLLERLDRDALTLLPSDLAALASQQELPVAVTRFDRALVGLASLGHLKLAGWSVEITAPDSLATSGHVEFLEACGAEVRRGAVHGLSKGAVELNLSRNVQARLVGDDVSPEPVCAEPIGGRPDEVEAARRVEPRQFSWVDVNRVADGANRINNCWNGAAAVAVWMASATPSTALPVYKGSGFRPTIKQYLAVMDAADVIFVDNEAGARAAIAAWGPGNHGLVVASLTAGSTHVFNAFVDAHGVPHVIDGHTGTRGDYNFEVDWLRIGIAKLGPMHPSFVMDIQQPS